MHYKKAILSLLLSFGMLSSYAAFPVKIIKEIPVASSVTLNNASFVATPAIKTHHSFFSHFFHDGGQSSARPRHKVVIRSRGFASVLCGIFIYPFPCYILGLHRLYLGYVWQGFLQMSGPWVGGVMIALALTIAAAPALIIAGVTLGACLILGAYIWQIVDYTRIRNRTLQPKWGYYRDDVDRARGYGN